MADDTEVCLDEAMARRVLRVVQWVERERKNPPPDGNAPQTFPMWLKIGKAKDVIPTRQSGQCDIWAGEAGSEANLSLSAPPRYFNATDQYVTQQKWLGIVGQYIVICFNPARDVWGTYNGSQVTVTDYANGDDPGSTLGGSSPNWPVSVDSTAGTNPPKSGADVRCLWHDRLQAYKIVSWSC